MEGALLENCQGFVGGTVRPICGPGENQQRMYIGHKKVHSMKFQSAIAANSMMASMYDQGKSLRHYSGMLGDLLE